MKNRSCVWCNDIFTPTSPNQRYCTSKCRRLGGHAARNKQHLCETCDSTLDVVHGNSRYCSLECKREAANSRRRSKERVKTNRCKACNSLYTWPTGRGGVIKYCSVECKRLATKAERQGLTPKQYTQMREHCNYRCEICGRSEKELGQVLCADHDHACCDTWKWCGKCIRGLLCNDCNSGLGYFRDNSARLAGAIEYLKRHEERDKI